jgi:transcriptional regulator with XRE-family HTH domain
MSNDIILEGWTEEQPTQTSHSRLYHLPPIGVGTPLVESLTSYIARLGASHSVHPRSLLLVEVAPYLSALAHTRTNELRRGAMSRLLTISAVWNGTTGSAKNMVEALTRLTERQDLHLLTLLPFQEVFSHKKLLRRSRAWCPRCFETWRLASLPVYEPLLWCLECVSICHIHEQRLQWCCPYSDCARTSPPLTGRSEVGYCPWCNRWLGTPFHLLGRAPSAWVNEEWKQQQWVATQLGEVLAAVPTLPAPLQRENALTVISSYVNEIMLGRHAEAARLLGLTASTVRQWLSGERIPQVRNLLQVCLSLDISLFALLLGTAHTTSWRNAPPPQLPASETKRRPFRKFDALPLQKALQEAVLKPEDPPLSLSKLAKRLGYPSPFLSRHFPELCQAISSSYQAYRNDKRESTFRARCAELDQVMSHLRDQGLRPTEKRVRDLLKSPSILRLPEIRDAWKTKLRDMGSI